MSCTKCQFPGGIVIKPDGVNELDACRYKEIARYENVTVIVNQCVRCGNVDYEWIRQENTIEWGEDDV